MFFRKMFFRKVDPAEKLNKVDPVEKQHVTEFLLNNMQWSEEIDRSLGKLFLGEKLPYYDYRPSHGQISAPSVDSVPVVYLRIIARPPMKRGDAFQWPDVTSTIRDVLSTIEKVRKTALQSKHWPVLDDVQGMRILMELRLLREDLFKHQILRMHIYSVVNESPKNTPLPDVIQQSIEATTEYESVLSKMSSTTDELMKRYEINTAEMLLIKRRSRHPRY